MQLCCHAVLFWQGESKQMNPNSDTANEIMNVSINDMPRVDADKNISINIMQIHTADGG